MLRCRRFIKLYFLYLLWANGDCFIVSF